MRQLTYAQIEFQRSQGAIFVRQPALLGALDKSHPLRKMFFDAAGLDVLDFLDLSYATYVQILEKKRFFSISWFDPLRKKYGASVDAYLKVVSRDYLELRNFFRGLPDAKQRWQSEYFEFTPLKRFPLYRIGDTFQAWHPMVFSRAIESLVHSVLCDSNAKQYMDLYSKIFEDHAMYLIRKSERPFLNEDELRRKIGRKERVTEAFLPLLGGNLFIEAKAGVFGEPVMTVGEQEFIARRVQSLVEAVGQARSAAAGIYSTDKTQSGDKNFLIVVTNRFLNISRGARLETLCGPELFKKSLPDLKTFLPIENVYFVAVDDFEHLMVTCATPSFDPIRFLEECVARDNNPVTTSFSFHQHLARLKDVDMKAYFAQSAIQAIVERLTVALDEC